jgi:hypothetical protein
MAGMARKLRIAVSVFFALVAVALCVLWVRSYWWWDVVVFNRQQNAIDGTSAFGSVGIGIVPKQLPADTGFFAYEANAPFRKEFYETSTLGFQLQHFAPGQGRIIVPIWLPIACFLALSAATWLRWSSRFSLRTMLIAMTLIAVVLGLGVWLAS